MYSDFIPNYNIPLTILKDTPINYPLCQNEEDALKYLELLCEENFIYRINSNFNIVDYEKLIYIEEKFKDSIKIQNILSVIKKDIMNFYIEKYSFLERLNDCKIDLEAEKTWHQGHLKFPDKYNKIFDEKDDE